MSDIYKRVFFLFKKKMESLGVNFNDCNYKDYLIKFVDDLFDCSNDVVFPLNKMDTYIFREYFNVNKSGLVKNVEDIAKEFNTNPTNIDLRMNIAFNEIKEIIVNKKNNNIGLSCLDMCIDNDISDKLIGEFNFSFMLHNKLINDGIYTFNNLLSKSVSYFKKNNYGPFMNELLEKVHFKGFKFVDELDDNERKLIFLNNDDSKKLDSSIDLLGLSKDSLKYLKKTIKDNNINTIGDLKKVIEYDSVFYFPVTNRFNEYNIPLNFKFDSSFFGDFSVDFLQISFLVVKKLNKLGIFYINDLLKFSKEEIYKLVNNRVQYNNIINNVYKWGLFFRDDVIYEHGSSISKVLSRN